MKALTVQQPWAWALIHGGKDVENRTQLWTYRGPLAIHAGATWSDRGGRSGLVWDALRDRVGWPTGPVSASEDRRHGFDVIRPAVGIIGVVDLVDTHVAVAEDVTEVRPRYFEGTAACCSSPWAEYPPRRLVHLVIENPRPLPEPIPCRGYQTLWTPDDAVLAQLREQVAA